MVTDFSPLREIRSCKEEVVERTSVALTVHEVDAHNVVPMWAASGKLEYSARTLRGKINKLLPEYLVEFPELEPPKKKWVGMMDKVVVDWDSLIDKVVRLGSFFFGIGSSFFFFTICDVWTGRVRKFLKLNGVCLEKMQAWKY